MIKNSIFLSALTILCGCSSVPSQDKERNAPEVLQRQVVAATFPGEKIKSDAEWLKSKYNQLASVKDPSQVTKVDMLIPEAKRPDGLYTYYPNGDGRIMFKDKTWVLIVNHSIHDEDGLGDLTLVRASDGKYYVNRGHVCGELTLQNEEKITSLNIFLKSNGLGAKAEPTPWEEYKGEQKN